MIVRHKFDDSAGPACGSASAAGEQCSPALISWGSDQKDHGDLTVVMDFKSKNLKCIQTQHVTYKQHTI